jgi:hypothetical protein
MTDDDELSEADKKQLRKAFAAANGRLREIFRHLAKVAPEVGEITKNLRAARKLRSTPANDEAKAAWEAIEDMTPRQVRLFWKFLPKPRGRRRGSGVLARDVELHRKLDVAIEAGEKPYAAAVRLLRDAGQDDARGRARALVRSRDIRRRAL